MTVLLRTMISPTDVPSRGTGSIVLGSATVIASTMG